MAAPSCLALLATCLVLQLATAGGDGCSGFGNLFTAIAENSAHGSLVARLPVAAGDAGGATLRLCLAGADAAWFYLDGRSVRLNVSDGRELDREELESPVLMVALTCTEDGFSPVEYRIIVQVLNENDNRPHFRGPPSSPTTSARVRLVAPGGDGPWPQLAAVHSVVFSAQAEDADGDTLMYVIDTASPDARFFRIDLPNSGRVVLARALDSESRQQLEVVVTAVEMNTKERFNASARVRVNVLDGDDQYPQFLPCTPRAHRGLTVCTSPVYTANVTEGQLQVGTRRGGAGGGVSPGAELMGGGCGCVPQTAGGPLSFSPGSVYAEDGDRGLRAAITYSLLADQESGRFHIDNTTGAITLLRAVESSRSTPAISLSVMAAQVNDGSKFAVAQAVVRVLAPNRHPRPSRAPRLRPGPPQGVNPRVRYSLSPGPNRSHEPQLFQVMPNGLLVARADHLRPAQSYRLQVLARDEESGETSSTTVELEVLWPGQAGGAEPPEYGGAGGGLGALLLLTAALLFLILRGMKKHQRQQEAAADRAALAVEKHPNVSLRWFQPVPPGKSSPTPPSLYYPNEGYNEGGEGSPPPLPPPAALPAPPTPKPQANSVGRPGGSPEDSSLPPPPLQPPLCVPPPSLAEASGGSGEGGGSPTLGVGGGWGGPGGLPALEEVNEESLEEGGTPPGCPPLLQLLEDSIEC
ncbi:unnamed protein product [Bubo scandiacus]